MGLYNMLFGVNQASPVILATLGLIVDDIGRFRDAYVCDGEIAIYTRLGGGNRECYCDNDEKHSQGYCYQPNIEKLQEHPNYIRDKDDDFDYTYATFYFSFPAEYAEGLKALDTGEEWNPDARWKAMLDALAASSK